MHAGLRPKLPYHAPTQPVRTHTRARYDADAGGGDVESRYAGAYEERVNPFREFIAGEKQARRRQLSAPDRIVFELGQVVSSSRCALLRTGLEDGRRGPHLNASCL